MQRAVARAWATACLLGELLCVLPRTHQALNAAATAAAACAQEWAVRTLNRPRPPGDPGKVDELRRVSRDLVTAHRIFEHLHRQGRASGIHRHKPEEHVNYVADAFNKTQVRAGGLASKWARARASVCRAWWLRDSSLQA